MSGQFSRLGLSQKKWPISQLTFSHLCSTHGCQMCSRVMAADKQMPKWMEPFPQPICTHALSSGASEHVHTCINADTSSAPHRTHLQCSCKPARGRAGSMLDTLLDNGWHHSRHHLTAGNRQQQPDQTGPRDHLMKWHRSKHHLCTVDLMQQQVCLAADNCGLACSH